MGLPQRKPLLTPEEYLAIERAAPYRSEFFRGEMFAMAGGTRMHSLIKTNLYRILGNLLIGKPCSVYDSDLRILVSATGLYTYPDASVACEPVEYEDGRRDTILNPVLLIEVLSEGSEAYDRGKKFEHYRKIEALREYIIVSQDRPKIERFARNPDDTWTLTDKAGMSESLELIAIQGKLSLADVFDKVEFDGEDSESKSASD